MLKLKNRVAENYAKILHEVTVNNGHRDLFYQVLQMQLHKQYF